MQGSEPGDGYTKSWKQIRVWVFKSLQSQVTYVHVQVADVLADATELRNPVKEFFCLKNQRLYYTHSRQRGTTWYMPPAAVLREVMTDMATYDLAVLDALACYQARSCC